MAKRKNQAPRTPADIEQALVDIGLDVISADKSTVLFWHNGHRIQYFPKTQWATGKSITDGRGWHNLLKQLQ